MSRIVGVPSVPAVHDLMTPLRLGLAVGAVHLALTIVGAIITLGASFGAHRPWAGSIFEQVVVALTAVLLLPFSLLNWLLPRHLAPGWPTLALPLTSILWGAAAYAIARWRLRTRATPSGR